MIKYEMPNSWITYNYGDIASLLVEAKSAILALRTIPFQREWVEALQAIELKREIAGTSKIEGADFTEKELDEALQETPEQLFTRSQRQAHAAMKAYRWIATLPDDFPVNAELILEIHKNIVTGADDDHCAPGVIRNADENVIFGQPRHRGAGGGKECAAAFKALANAIKGEYREHDMIIQAIAAHYHFAAMHPFLDGNGRTARALEALMLQNAGLRDTCFIAMSNYYYDEKLAYLKSLAESRKLGHDLTPFLQLGLTGIAIQSKRLLKEIQVHVQKTLYINLMYDLFNRLETKRKRVIVERQVKILKVLLKREEVLLSEIFDQLLYNYKDLKNPIKAFIRDVNGLIGLKTIFAEKTQKDVWLMKINLKWPTEITETEFFERIKKMPNVKGHISLSI